MSIAIVADISIDNECKLFCTDGKIRFAKQPPHEKVKCGDYVVYSMDRLIIYDIIEPTDYIREMCREAYLPLYKNKQKI